MGEGFSVELVLNSDEDEVGFVQSYKHLYEVDPENEAMQESYRRYLSYERNGYVVNNARFRDELQSKSIWDFKKPDWLGEDNDCWYSISLHSFSEVCAEAYELGERDIAAAAICKLARERGLRVERNEIDNGMRYILICLKF